MLEDSKYSHSFECSSAEDCNLCEGVDLIKCMIVSVKYKHNEQPDTYSNVIDQLLFQKRSTAFCRYTEVVKEIQKQDCMTQYFGRKEASDHMDSLFEYYKYRRFIPLTADSTLMSLVSSYYYERLKIYYNQIKRKLSITVEESRSDLPSSDVNDTSGRTSFSGNRASELEKFGINDHNEVLKDLTKFPLEAQKQGESKTLKANERLITDTMNSFKTESKALEDMINVLKKNTKFDFINTVDTVEMKAHKSKLKSSKEIFRDTLLERKKSTKKLPTKNQMSGFTKQKIFMTFYSRDIPAVAEIYKTKLQKPVKSKNLATLEMEKEQNIKKKMFRKKEEVLHENIVTPRKSKGSSKSKIALLDRQCSNKKIRVKSHGKLKLANERQSDFISSHKSPPLTAKKKSEKNSKSQNKLQNVRSSSNPGLNKIYLSGEKSRMEVRSSMSIQRDSLLKGKNKLQGQTVTKNSSQMKADEKVELKLKLKKKNIAGENREPTKKELVFEALQSQRMSPDFMRKNVKKSDQIVTIWQKNVVSARTSPLPRHLDRYIQKADNIVSLNKKKLEVLRQKAVFNDVKR